jgi:hypothetical protein
VFGAEVLVVNTFAWVAGCLDGSSCLPASIVVS